MKINVTAPKLRGVTTTTKWGQVAFDSNGVAELEVAESDLPTLQALGWWVPPVEAPPVDESPVEDPPSFVSGTPEEALAAAAADESTSPAMADTKPLSPVKTKKK